MTKMGQNLVDQWFRKAPISVTAGQEIEYRWSIDFTHDRMYLSPSSIPTILVIGSSYLNYGTLKALSTQTSFWYDISAIGY